MHNDLKPAYAFAYVTEPQEIKEEEEVNLSPTVFKWFWYAAAAVGGALSYRSSRKAVKKAAEEITQAEQEAQRQQQNLINVQRVAKETLEKQDAIYKEEKEKQKATQKESDLILEQAKADTLAAQQTGSANIGQATKESKLAMAAAEAQTEQQLALSEAATDKTQIGQPGISFTKVQQPSALGIGGTVEPDENTEASSGLTI